MARKANLRDLFKLSRLIDNLDMKENIIEIYENKNSIKEKGFDFIFFVLSKVTEENTEKMLYEVLSGPFEMDPEKIGDIDLDNLVSLFEECFTLKTVINFIKRVSDKG